MTYSIWGWTDEETGLHHVRVRCLTIDLVTHSWTLRVYRQSIEGYMIDDFSVEANPDSFTRRDLEGDESVPEEERPYSYLEMTS